MIMIRLILIIIIIRIHLFLKIKPKILQRDLLITLFQIKHVVDILVIQQFLKNDFLALVQYVSVVLLNDLKNLQELLLPAIHDN